MYINSKLQPYLTVSQRGALSVFQMRFRSLSDIEYFLTHNPPINDNIFVSQKSKNAKEEFAGDPLDKAIEYCVRGYEKDFDVFLKLKKELESANKKKSNVSNVNTSVVGSRPNVPAYIAGAPKTMYRVNRANEKKIIHIYMNLAYSRFTTNEQIINRGILVLNLINMLEQNDYIVDFQVFEACAVENEAYVCEVMLKRPGELLDVNKCYYPLCGKEFLRRVLTNVKETMPFSGNWHFSYGEILNQEKTRIVMNLPKDALLISFPEEMGIEGKNIYKDADVFLNILGLEKYIRIPRYSEE